MFVTDGQMLRMNGYDFAHRIREVEARSGGYHRYILGCSSRAAEEDTYRGIDVGVNRVLFSR
ncbi:hypothetical protein [Pseudomonas chlororaphis]|uniref:hypothetical protein n=1 Tax=Pseudomonas chlororaphis TaxID=587753 RepID=UPI003BB74CFB